MSQNLWFKLRQLVKRQKRIAIDLVPLLPQEENGGAKIVILELLQHLTQQAPQYQFILLTSPANHDELQYLECKNIKRHRLATSTSNMHLLPELNIDLLFCPFHAISYANPEIPIVSIIHDLQYLYYPYFFTSEERQRRHQFLTEICQKATRLICVSDYTKKTLIQNFPFTASKSQTIYNRVHQRFSAVSIEEKQNILKKYGLEEDQFLLYPANAWPHKNHEILLDGYFNYQQQQGDSVLKLICPGKISAKPFHHHMDQIIFPGFISQFELHVLMQHCFALIYPSLFEGFGIPIAEAMANNKAVLCSATTSLPEVAGHAALYFDPNDPETITDAIFRLRMEPDLRQSLILEGQKQIQKIGNIQQMATDYLSVFSELLTQKTKNYQNAVYGVYSDGWCSEKLKISYQDLSVPNQLAIILHAPGWIKPDRLDIQIKSNKQKYILNKGENITIQHSVIQPSGVMEIQISPTFSFSEINASDDKRHVSCILKDCSLWKPLNENILEKLQLTPKNYLFYPAHFSKHNNHELLFLAFLNYRKKSTLKKFKLICVGAHPNRSNGLKQLLETMGLSDTVIIQEYVNHDEYNYLLNECLAVTATLPCDFRNPEDITNALLRLEHEQQNP